VIGGGKRRLDRARAGACIGVALGVGERRAGLRRALLHANRSGNDRVQSDHEPFDGGHQMRRGRSRFAGNRLEEADHRVERDEKNGMDLRAFHLEIESAGGFAGALGLENRDVASGGNGGDLPIDLGKAGHGTGERLFEPVLLRREGIDVSGSGAELADGNGGFGGQVVRVDLSGRLHNAAGGVLNPDREGSGARTSRGTAGGIPFGARRLGGRFGFGRRVRGSALRVGFKACGDRLELSAAFDDRGIGFADDATGELTDHAHQAQRAGAAAFVLTKRRIDARESAFSFVKTPGPLGLAPHGKRGAARDGDPGQNFFVRKATRAECFAQRNFHPHRVRRVEDVRGILAERDRDRAGRGVERHLAEKHGRTAERRREILDLAVNRPVGNAQRELADRTRRLARRRGNETEGPQGVFETHRPVAEVCHAVRRSPAHRQDHTQRVGALETPG